MVVVLARASGGEGLLLGSVLLALLQCLKHLHGYLSLRLGSPLLGMQTLVAGVPFFRRISSIRVDAVLHSVGFWDVSD